MKFLEKKVNTVLITGGNSTVGKDLVNLFLKDNFKVIAIIRKKTKKKKYKKNYKEIHLDYLKSIKIRKKVDFVVNTIATHEYSTNKQLDDYYEGNIKCIKKIVDFCKKKKKKILINL